MEQAIPLEPDKEFEGLVKRAEELTLKFEQHPILSVREDVLELLQTVDVIHRAAIYKLVELVIASGNHELIHRAAEDPRVSTILQLYDVLPLPVLARWQEFLDTLRPELKAKGAGIDLIHVVDEMPSLQLTGAFTGEESEIRHFVQESIAAAFGTYQSVRWEPRVPPPATSRLVPISAIQPAKRRKWVDLLAIGELPTGEMRRLEVKEVEVLLAHSSQDFHAFSNACPGTALPLHLGRIWNDRLICPWHACEFELRTGKREAGTGADLKPMVLRIEGGSVQLGLWE